MATSTFTGVSGRSGGKALSILAMVLVFATACGYIDVDRLGLNDPEDSAIDTPSEPLETGTSPTATTELPGSDSVVGDGGESRPSDVVTTEGTGSETDSATVSASDSTSDSTSDGGGSTATWSESGTERDTDSATGTENAPDGGADAGDADGGEGAGKNLYGYYMGYQSWDYPGDAVDFDSLTHLIVGRLAPRADGSLSTDFDMDDVNGPLMAQDMVTRTHGAGRTAILLIDIQEEAIWLEAASEANRPTLLTSVVTAMETYGFDGLDLAYAPSTQEAYLLLVALADELRVAVPGVTLSFATGWVGTTQSVSPFAAGTAEHFDQLFVATFGMGNSWSGWQSWHNAPLYGDTPATPSSVETTVQKLLDAGIPAGKIHIALPFFGSCWEGVTGPLQDGGTYLAGDNAMSYANIMNDYYPLADEDLWDGTARVPYLGFAQASGTEGCTFVSYDNPQSIQEKGAFIHEAGLGGAFIWTLAQGYLQDNPVGARNPLLSAASQSILTGP